jgi:uncharacterized protein involved in response to NO
MAAAGGRSQVGGRVWLEHGFRPLFLAAAVFVPLHVGAWLGILAGVWPAPAWLAAPFWHAHEMLFGVVAAAIAGFLLTAVPVWTASRPPAPSSLAALFALWLAGRLAMGGVGWLPAFLPAALDLAFLLVLAAFVGVRVLRARQRRNAGFPLLLLALAAANALVHLEALGLARETARTGLRAGVWWITLLVVLVGGRITPSFTANALRRAGDPARVVTRPWVERLVVPCVLVVLVLDLALSRSPVTGAAAGVAGAVLALRLAGWQTRRTLRDPLLWSLHLGQAWLPVALFALAASNLLDTPPWTSALHALTTGAVGTMLLAVMTRVPLGHTGRPLRAPPAAVLAYALVSAGAVGRSAGPALAPDHALPVLLASGALWAIAFAVYAVGYAPILLGPRVGGEPA